MMKRYYQFAGMKLEVSMPEELFFEKERKLTLFRVEAAEPDWFFRYEKAEELLPPAGRLVETNSAYLTYADTECCIRYIDAYDSNWEKASARVEYRGNQVAVQLKSEQFPNHVTEKYVLKCLCAEHLVARNHGFIFHCSFIEHNGKAILFTAPSETGKSTQAELWKDYRGVRIINGDRAVVRLAEGVLLAEGIPFAGSSQYCENATMTIETIVYLRQAPETSIRKLRGYEAFSRIWEGVSVDIWDREDLEQVSAVVQKAAETIPVYHLSCTPDESAVAALEEALRKQVKV